MVEFRGFKNNANRKYTLLLLGLFALSAVAAIFLSAVPASAKTQQNSSQTSINVNGRETSISNPLPMASSGQSGPTIVQTGRSFHQSNSSTGYMYTNPSYGNWTFVKATPWVMQYTNTTGKQTVALSTFGILAGGTFYNTHVLTKLSVSPMSYTVNATVETITGTVGGYVWVNVNFNVIPPKVSEQFYKTGTFTSYNVIWENVGDPYAKVNGTYYNVPAQAVTTINSQTSMSLYSSSSSLSSTVLSWIDFGSATVRMTATVIDGKLYHAVYVMFTTNVPNVDPSIVQFQNNGSGAFGSNVTSGNILVAVATFYASNTGSPSWTATDTQNNGYTVQATETYQESGGSGGVECSSNSGTWCSAVILTATASSSAADTITVKFGGTSCVSVPCNGVAVYEVSGSSSTSIASAVGEGNCGSSCSASTANLSFNTNAIIIAGGTQGACSSGLLLNAGTDFTRDNGVDVSEYSDTSSSGLSSPTTAPWSTCSSNSFAVGWVDVAIALNPPSVTVQLSLSIQNGATADSASVTCTGGGGTYTSAGGTQTFTCNPSVTVTATLTAGGSTNQWCFSGQCTNSENWTSCSSGTCTLQSYNYYEQFKNTLGFSLAVGTTTSGLTWAWTGYQSGSSGQTLCSTSPGSGVSSGSTATCWSDYNRAITAPAEPTVEASNERFRNVADGTSTAGTPTTGGNTYTTTYYRQEDTTYQVSTNGNGPPTWDSGLSVAFTGTYLGAGSVTICTSSPSSGTTTTSSCSGGHTGWADYNTAVTIPSLMSGAGSNIQWKVYGTASWTETTPGNTVIATEYKQLQNIYAAHPSSPSTFSASITFIVTGTLGGTATQTICTITVPGSPAAQDYNCTGYADYNLAVSLPAQSTNNPANAVWVNLNTRSFTDTTGGNTHTTNYQEDFSNTYNANPTAPTTFSGSITFTVTGTIGGSPGQTVCIVSVPASPSSGAYSCSGPTDTGTLATISATSGSNPASTRWQVSGTNSWTDGSGGNSHTANYYEQFQQTFRITANAQTNFDGSMTFTITGTLLGTGGQTICTLAPASNATDTCSTGSTKSWADYNTQVSFPVNPTGAPANSRWQASVQCTFTQTTGGNTDNCNYYKQWTNNFLYSVTYGGSPSAPTLTCNQFGSPVSSLTLSMSNQAFYCDNSASATATSPIAGAANEQWSDNAQSFTITSGGSADTFVYYHQYDQTLSYSVSGGGSPTAPTATGTEFGSGYTPSLTTSPTKYWFDVTGSITFTNPTTGSSGTERWKTPTTSLSATSIGTAAPVYYHQYNYQFDYSITDGGAGYTAPTLTITYFSVGGNTSSLTTSMVHYWADAGTSATSTNPLTGSGSNERWYTATASVTISSSTTYTFAYYHQYLQTYSYTITGGAGSSSAPTFTYTYLGAGGQTQTASTTPATQFVDSTTSWTFTNPLTGSSGSERWDATGGTSGSISSAATINPNYYHQYSYTLSYSVSGGGSPTVPTFSCLQFGGSLVYTLTGGPTVEWVDSSCSYSFTNPAQLVNMPTSPTPKERWFTGITTSGSVGSAQTIAATYYNQYWFNNTAFTLTYVYTGVTEPASVYQGWIDSGSSLTVAGVYSHIWTPKTQGSLYQSSNGIQFYSNHSISSFVFITVPLQITFTGVNLNMTQFMDSSISMTMTGVKDNGGSISFTTVSVSDGTIYKFVGSSSFVIAYSSTGIISLTTGTPIYQPYQTKTFAALSYFWAFYCDATNINLRTSSDGITWSASTTIAVCTSGSVFSTTISGTTVAYARTNGTVVYYRLGTISISGGVGVITWTAVEQTAVASSAGNTYSNVYVAIDTHGYSWISYNTLNSGTDYAMVTETQNTNGVWAAAAGFPYQSASSGAAYAQEVIPLTAGKVAVVWSQTSQKLTLAVWTGSTWTSTYQNTNVISNLYYFSAQASFDNVNIVYLYDNSSTYQVQLTRFFYSPIGFAADTKTSTTSTTSTSAPVLYKNSVTGDEEIIYVGSSNTFYGVSFSTAAALGTPHSVYADLNTITNNDQLDIVPLSDSTARIGVMFVENPSTPWKLQYLVLYSSASFDLILNPSVGSHAVNATNYFVVTYTLNGAIQTLHYTGTLTSTLINADAGSNVTISGASFLSNTSKEVWWFQTSGADVTFIAGNATTSYVYYDLLAQVAQYAIVGGGSPTAPVLTYVTVPASASPTDNPLTTAYTLTTSPVTVYMTRTSTSNTTPQLNGITNEVWTPKVASWKITVFNQISNPINYYHQYQTGVSYKLLFGGGFTAPTFTYVADGAAATLLLTTANQNIYVDVSSAWSVTNPLAGGTSTERAGTNPSSGTLTTITTYVFSYTHQFAVQFKFALILVNGVAPSYSGHPTLTVIQGQAKTTITLTTNFATTWVDAGTEWQALNPWVSGANSFNPTIAGGIVSSQGQVSNTNPITIYYGLAPRCIGTNTVLLAEEGCFFPAVFFVYANLMGPFFAGLLIAGLCMAIYVKTDNAVISVFLFFVSAIVLGALFPPIFGEAILIGLAALISMAIFEMIRSNQ